MRIERAGPAHRDGWARLRADLWRDETAAAHARSIDAWLADERAVAFVAVVGHAVAGFAEASVRVDHVNGCDTSPVAFLEGLAVAPAHRRRGIARALVGAVEDWARQRGLGELGSDSDADNADGQAAHVALGFAETERVVFYRKPIGANGSTPS